MDDDKPGAFTRRQWLATAAGAIVGATLAGRGRAGARAGAARVRWCWVGGVGDTRAVVVAAFDRGDAAGVEIDDDVGGDPPRVIVEAGAAVSVGHAVAFADGGVVRFEVLGLTPATRYAYRFLVDGHTIDGGGFETLPAHGRPASFEVALASCNSRADNPAFKAIARQAPLLFMQNGDLHYDNITSNLPDDFRRAFDRELSDPSQRELYRSCAVSYMWDDHDYGPNNARHDNPSRAAAHMVYRERVPHYPLPLKPESGARAAPIFQAFTIGRVRFVLTDLRSEAQRVPGTILGKRQRDRFFSELATAARTHGLIIWMSSVPWIDADDLDGWGGAQDERRIVANFIRDQKIPLCIVSGDAHMCAIDDGSHADYADGGGAPVPVFQAGALGSRGSYKGGPYSHGAAPGEGQFGWMKVEDDGAAITVTWEARNGSDGVGARIVEASTDGSGPIRHRFTASSNTSHRPPGTFDDDR